MTTLYNAEAGLPIYLDSKGQALKGSIYFGVPNLNPVTNPVTVYWDAAGTQPAMQPVAVSNGRTVRTDGTPSRVWISGDYSMLVVDSKGGQVDFQTNQQTPAIPTTETVDKFSGTGAPATYTLSVTPQSINDTSVFVGGVYQQKSSYTLAGNQLTITAAVGTNNVEVNTAKNLDWSSIASTLNTAAATAQTNATAAAASRSQMLYIVQGSFAPGTPPTHRDDGSAIQAGDYASFTDNLFRRYNGATWVASDINTANLAASSGSSLVGYGTGTVADDLNAARPVARGGTGSTTASGALANLGVVNVGSESTINASVTIANTFPASYLITDSGTPADYNVFLPAAAAVGSVVFFRVSQTATKLFTLYDGGTTMDGVDRRILWAGESCMLKKTATGWTKIGGQSIPFRGRLKLGADLALTSGAWQNIMWTAADANSKGFNSCFDSVNGRFKAQRDGTFRFIATVSMAGLTDGTQSDVSFTDGVTVGPYGIENALSSIYKPTGVFRQTHCISIMRDLTRLATVNVTARGTGTPKIEYLATSVEASLWYEEIITW